MNPIERFNVSPAYFAWKREMERLGCDEITDDFDNLVEGAKNIAWRGEQIIGAFYETAKGLVMDPHMLKRALTPQRS